MGAVIWLLFSATVLLAPEARGQAPPPRLGLQEWFAHLRAGMWVKVEGAMADDGALHATEVEIFDGELDEWEVSSNVTEVDVTRLRLQTEVGITVVATPRTELQGPVSRRHVGFPFLAPGDRMEAEGRPQKDGSLLADEIEIKRSKRLDSDLPYENEHELTARIESLDSEKLGVVLMGVQVYFNDRTRNKSPLLD